MQNKYFWAGLGISAMWLAVLFVGVFGPSLEVTSGAETVNVPAAPIAVAFFAMVGTILVAIYGFRK